MGKGLRLSLAALLALFLCAGAVRAQLPPDCLQARAYAATLARAATGRLISALLSHVPRGFWGAFPFSPQAQSSDGGGDGAGSGDGDSSGASGDSSGDTSTSDTSAADATGTEADSAADAISAPTTDPAALSAQESPLGVVQDQATTDPRGGSAPSLFDAGGAGSALAGPHGPVAPVTRAPPAGPVDITINAVIVSAAQSPWDAIQRAPGVGKVTVHGGIIALGERPLPGEPPGGGSQPSWLRMIPDASLLDGSVIPPVVPNIIDIRCLKFPIEVVEPTGN